MGGQGSGYFEHAGRPGLVGGSGPGGAGLRGSREARERSQRHEQARRNREEEARKAEDERTRTLAPEAEQRIAEKLKDYEADTKESSFVFDKDGKLLWEGTEGKRGEAPNPPGRLLRDNIVVHNHPDQTAPSVNDLGVALKSSAKEERVLTAGYQYTFRKTERFSQAKQKEIIGQVDSLYKSIRTNKMILELLSNHQLTLSDAQVWHRVYMKIAKDTPGFIYSRRRITGPELS